MGLGIAVACSSGAVSSIPLQLADASAVQIPSNPMAWGGERSGARSSGAARADQVVDYKISAGLNPRTHRIEGEQVLRWRNRSDQPVSVVYFHAYLNAFADQHSTFLTEAKYYGEHIELTPADRGYICLREITQLAPAPGENMTLVESACLDGPNDNLTYVQTDGGPKTDRTVFALTLAQPIAAGQSAELKMRFVSQLPKAIARAGHAGSFHMAAQWFPKIAVLELAGERGATAVRWNAHEYHFLSEYYADFGQFDVRIQLPKSMRVAATGVLHSTRQLAGDLLEYRFVQNDVHDFAFAADTGFAKPLAARWVSTNGNAVEIQVFFNPQYASHAPVVLGAIQASLNHAEQHLGEYPYASISAIIPPFNATGVAGMEYPTLFTVNTPEHAPAGSFEADELAFVTVHEFFHNYFHGVLASNEIEEPWLDEGVNEYWNVQFLQEQGERAIVPSWLQKFGLSWRVPQIELSRAYLMREAKLDALGSNAWGRMSTQDYFDIYPRGALLLHDLQTRWGTARMRRAMRHYLKTWQFRHPSSADFREALIAGAALCTQECSNTAFDPVKEADFVRTLFTELVYQDGVIDDRIVAMDSSCRTAQPQQSLAKAIETRVELQRIGVQLPQQLELRFADGTSQRADVARSENQLQYVNFLSQSCPISARLDPERRYSLDRSSLDNSRSVHAKGVASRRWHAELFAALTMLYSALLSL